LVGDESLKLSSKVTAIGDELSNPIDSIGLRQMKETEIERERP
jgi:hypothetical protein